MRHGLAVLCLLLPMLAMAQDNGGEGDNTGCYGEGNPNSPCDPGNGSDHGEETGQAQTQEATATSTSSSESSSESVSGAESSATGGSASATGGSGGEGGSAVSESVATGGSVGDTTSESVSSAEGGIGYGGEGGSASVQASNEGVNVNNSSNYESNNTNVVLVPNNNSENCLRVFGFSWGGSGNAGAFGIPWRSSTCDYEQAADDAAAMGNHELAWWWRCHKDSLQKTFKIKGLTKEQAHLACWNSMVQMIAPDSPESFGYEYVAPTEKVISIEEYESLLLAQVQQEELEVLEDQYEEQQTEIQTLIEEREDDSKELERLKREAEQLRKAQKEREEADAKAKAKFKARLKAKEKPE